MKFSIVMIFVCLIGSYYAQENLSARDAVIKALENNYDIEVAELQKDIGTMNNTWSEAGAFPTVDLQVSQMNTIQDNTNNPFTFTPGIFLIQGVNPSLNANWNIFSGFAVRISKERLAQLEEQSSQNALTVVEQITQDVLKAYYTAQLQTQRTDLFESVLDLSRERLEYYRLKAKYSSTNSLELLQFENQYLTDSANLLLQEISLDNSMRNLKLLMNEDSTRMNVEYILTDFMDLDVVTLDFDLAQKNLMENNANLKSQYISLELQKTNTEFQKSFLYPTLSFQAGVQPGWSWFREMNSSMPALQTRSLSYYGNLNLRYTLFNNWKSKRAIEVSKIQEEIAEVNIYKMKKTLSASLQNLIDLYNARVQIAMISEQNVGYAKRAYDLGKIRFETGALNSIELTTLLNNYQNTVVQHYENLFNRIDTYLEIYKMTGKLRLEYTP